MVTSEEHLQNLVANASGQNRSFSDQGVEVLPGAIETSYIVTSAGASWRRRPDTSRRVYEAQSTKL